MSAIDQVTYISKSKDAWKQGKKSTSLYRASSTSVVAKSLRPHPSRLHLLAQEDGILQLCLFYSL